MYRLSPQEALHEFEAIFWMDSSGRLARKQNKTHWDSVYATARRTEGVVQFDITGRDIFQCTHGAMYRCVDTYSLCPGA
jgi:hypothetical protein